MSVISKLLGGGGGAAIGGIIGSVVPGIGTAIGASIGAGAGALSNDGKHKVNAIANVDGTTQQFTKTVKNLAETSTKQLKIQNQELDQEKKQTKLIVISMITIGVVGFGIIVYKLSKR